MNKKRLFMFFIIITIAIISSCLICLIINKTKTTETFSENIIKNEIVNNIIEEKDDKIENNIIDEENNIEEDTNSINIKEQQPNSEEITKEEVESMKTNEEKAIEIAKKNWGEDSKVVFVNDGVSKSTGRYIVAVRNAATRNAICYYHIDINTGEFNVEN